MFFVCIKQNWNPQLDSVNSCSRSHAFNQKPSLLNLWWFTLLCGNPSSYPSPVPLDQGLHSLNPRLACYTGCNQNYGQSGVPALGWRKPNLLCGQQAKDRTRFWLAEDGLWLKWVLSFASFPHHKFGFLQLSAGATLCSRFYLLPGTRDCLQDLCTLLLLHLQPKLSHCNEPSQLRFRVVVFYFSCDDGVIPSLDIRGFQINKM